MVRYYTTNRMNGAIAFKCNFCDHVVTTRNFDSAKGNCRTQAATEMNRHAAESHASSSQTATPAKLSPCGAL